MTKKDILLEINGRVYKLSKLEDDTFAIKYAVKPKEGEEYKKWYNKGYYGNIEDMVWALIKMTVGIPKHEELVEQVKLLRQELKQVEQNIVAQLKEVVEIK